MKDPKDALKKRRDEILAEIDEGSREERIELDTDPEEQAIQIEHHQVSVSRVDNLRRELAEIEDRLASMD